MQTTGTRALILGGGGLTGIAWELGILKGLRDAGLDLGDAELIIGTSAGSVVGTQLATGRDLDQLYAEQVAPSESNPKRVGGGKLDKITLAKIGLMLVRPGSATDKRRRLGQASIKAHPNATGDRLAVIRGRVGDPDWPDRDLRITAVDADSGGFVVFDRDSGVRLYEAVAASCSVPLVWAPVRIGENTYIDGGVRSATNADLATGADSVIAIAPIARSLTRHHALPRQLARTGASRTAQLSPDKASLAAIGPNVLDPRRRTAAAEAGIAQARAHLDELAAVWGP